MRCRKARWRSAMLRSSSRCGCADFARRLTACSECGERRARCRAREKCPQAASSYARVTALLPARILRMIVATVTRRDHLDLDRDRGAAARSQPDQAVAAALQRATARRQIVSLYPDHGRSLGAADPQTSRRAIAAWLLFGPFASAGAVDRTITALQRAFLVRSWTDES